MTKIQINRIKQQGMNFGESHQQGHYIAYPIGNSMIRKKKYIIKKKIHLEEVKITTEDYLNKVWPRQWYPTRCCIRDRGRLQHRHFLSPSQARQASIVISTT